MNKELIKKYKREFNHWLNGGTILARVITSDEDNFMYTVWYEVDCGLENWKADYLFNLTDKQVEYYKPQFIVRDEYSEFAKALADGKTIEIFNKHTEEWANIDKIIENTNIALYRIKPEEPKFKAGDFVGVGCDGDSPKTIKIFHKKSIDEPPYVYIMKDSTKWDKCIKWDPYHKELCWFTTRAAMLDGVNYAVLGYFNTIVGLDYTTTDGATFRHCEPFLNSKPSWFN